MAPTILTSRRSYIAARRPFDPGLRVHHDPKSEEYLWTDTQPKLVARGAVRADDLDDRGTVRHRVYRRYDQIGGSCTGYAPVTLLSTAHEFNRPEDVPIDGLGWYERNRAKDRANGLNFPEGATVAASMDTGKDLGIWPAYRWIYDHPNAERAAQTRALIWGTNWYPSMFERDREGIMKMPRPGEQPVGGHEFETGAWIQERGLWRIEQTWKPIGAELAMPFKGWVYYMPAELAVRLIREEGEIAVPDEVKFKRAA